MGQTSSEPEPRSLPLRLHAYRRGNIELGAVQGQLAFVIDDVPVAVVDGRPIAHQAWLRSFLRPREPWWAQRFDSRVTATAGDLRAGQELMLSREFWQDFHNPVWGVETLEFRNGQWRSLVAADPIWSYGYAAIVDRAGAKVGLRHWGLNFARFETSHARALHDTVHELGEAPAPDFVWLSAPGGELPRTPKVGELLPHTAAVTSDGELGVLLEDEGCKLARWPVDSITPTIEPLPGSDGRACGEQTRLRAQDGLLHILGHVGAEPYAATVQAGDLEALDLSTFPSSDRTSTARWIAAAARTPTGDWWVLEQAGEPSREPAQGSVDNSTVGWRPNGSTKWRTPTIPRVTVPARPKDQWSFEDQSQTWLRLRPSLAREVAPRVRDLRWAAGALWLAVELGERDPFYLAYFGVMTSAPGHEVFELPAVDQVALDVKTSRPDGDCELFTVVLWPALESDAQLATLVEQHWQTLADVAVLREGDDWGVVTHVFVARRGTSRALVAEAQATTQTVRERLARSLARTFDQEVELVCGSFELLASVGFPARDRRDR